MSEERLNWHALRMNCCPKCGEEFMDGLSTVPINHEQKLIHPCGFQIRESKYRQIVSKHVSSDLERRSKEEDIESEF